MAKKTKISIIIFTFMILLFLYGLILYPHSSTRPSGNVFEGPSLLHFLGTDDLGIDIFAQISIGFFYSLKIGVSVAFISLLIGGILGYISGYFGGYIDVGIMFLVDIFMGVPELPIIILISSFLKPGDKNLILTLSLFSWFRITKIVRDVTITEVNKEYILISKKFGGNPIYILFKHLFNEIFIIVIIHGSRLIGNIIVKEASLSFLGIGDPTKKSLGTMMSRAMKYPGIYFVDFWIWWLLPPIMVLLLSTYIFRTIGRELENNWGRRI